MKAASIYIIFLYIFLGANCLYAQVAYDRVIDNWEKSKKYHYEDIQNKELGCDSVTTICLYGIKEIKKGFKELHRFKNLKHLDIQVDRPIEESQVRKNAAQTKGHINVAFKNKLNVPKLEMLLVQGDIDIQAPDAFFSELRVVQMSGPKEKWRSYLSQCEKIAFLSIEAPIDSLKHLKSQHLESLSIHSCYMPSATFYSLLQDANKLEFLHVKSPLPVKLDTSFVHFKQLMHLSMYLDLSDADNLDIIGRLDSIKSVAAGWFFWNSFDFEKLKRIDFVEYLTILHESKVYKNGAGIDVSQLFKSILPNTEIRYSAFNYCKSECD